MEMPIKLIVIVAIVAVLLVAMMMFLFQSSGTTLSRTDAERVFATQCQNYVQRGCTWEVTYEKSFDNYMNACRTLYGDERDSFSCLYSLCKGCFETNDLKCAGMCNTCSGHEAASVNRETCCARFKSQCALSSVDCGACV